ncbi:MAG: DUF1015 family protein [Euryarchaeota archaeon]|nr:DUF1015 family protein [Euryarchaeota archaeon]
MDVIRGFKGIGYSKSLNPLDPYLTLPYDEIKGKKRLEYLKKSNYNFVRIILPEEDEDPLLTIRSFMSKKIFERDKKDNIYLFEQEFYYRKRRYLRRGFIALLNLDYARENVHPHEKIFQAPMIQRLKLLEKTGFDLEPIFLLYDERFAKCFRFENLELLAWGEEPAGIINRLYSSEINFDGCDAGEFVIADGHHRFSAALEFYKNKSVAGWIMAYFVDLNNESLFILPSYKVVKGAKFNIKELEDYFDIEKLEGTFNLIRKNAFLMQSKEGSYILNLKEKSDLPEPVIFEEIIMKKIIRLKINVKNVKTFRSVDNISLSKNDVSFIFRPPSPKEVWDFAIKGGIMPQKSTYFYPKIASGLRIFDKINFFN